MLTHEHLIKLLERYEYLLKIRDHSNITKKQQIQNFLDNQAGQLSASSIYEAKVQFNQQPSKFETCSVLQQELISLEIQIEFLKHYLGE